MKGLVAQSLFASRLRDLLIRDAAVVVAFHRVHDGAGADGLTIGRRMFERYCRYFQRHFNVIPLRDLVERLRSGSPVNRELAITFDDGYRDNFEQALPVLQKFSLPATFFVVSQWMGTDVVPWWDEERSVRHPWMTWDQVRSLSDKGFEIGAHTRTHADLGRLSEAEAREEILGARIELERQLLAPVESFAYPYGGRRNLTQQNRALIKAAGFRCCCSAFGGINTNATDPFHLRRVPISPWYESPHEFGFDVAFGRTVLHA